MFLVWIFYPVWTVDFAFWPRVFEKSCYNNRTGGRLRVFVQKHDTVWVIRVNRGCFGKKILSRRGLVKNEIAGHEKWKTPLAYASKIRPNRIVKI